MTSKMTVPLVFGFVCVFVTPSSFISTTFDKQFQFLWTDEGHKFSQKVISRSNVIFLWQTIILV